MASPHAVSLWSSERSRRERIPYSQARLEIYPPRKRLKRRVPAIVILPGGGYGGTSFHEGVDVARFVADRGYYGIVLLYRVAPAIFPAPLADACRGMRLVRRIARVTMIDPRRVGIMGFSAGAHLAALVATQPDLYLDPEDDLVGRYSARPDRLMLVYPLVSLDRRTHDASVRNLLGERPSKKKRLMLSNHLHVDRKTPSSFIVHASDDGVVPVQNALWFADACAERGVSVEMHIYARGAHGFGLAESYEGPSTWTSHLLDWLSNWKVAEAVA